MVNEHIPQCIKNTSLLKENEDYVVCKICNLHKKKISNHLKRVHNLTTKEYQINYNSYVLCTNSAQSYSSGNSRESWVKSASEEEIFLWKKKISKSVSETIMSSPAERKRRSEFMIHLNKIHENDEDFRKLLSDTAKITSARPDIQKQRAERLKNWRDNNPEVFRRCIDRMHQVWITKPEMKLEEFLSSKTNFNFKRSQFITSNTFFTKTNRKQIDFLDVEKNIYIEYDGQIHFKDFFKNGTLDKIREKDRLLNQFIIDNDYVLIRIGYDQFINKQNLKNCHFTPECLEKIEEILRNPQPGIYRIGKVYEQY